MSEPFSREAVSARRPVFLSRRLPPPCLPYPCAHGMARKKANTRPIPVKRELEPTAFWRRKNSGGMRRRRAVGARSRACGSARASRRCAKSPIPSQQAPPPTLRLLSHEIAWAEHNGSPRQLWSELSRRREAVFARFRARGNRRAAPRL